MFGQGCPLDRAGIVHKDVDDRVFFVDLRCEGLQCAPVTEVALVGVKASAERLHISFDRAARAFQAGTDTDDIRSGFCTCHCHGFADPPLGARDKGGFSRKAETVQNTHVSFLVIWIMDLIALGFCVSASKAPWISSSGWMSVIKLEHSTTPSARSRMACS